LFRRGSSLIFRAANDVLSRVTEKKMLVTSYKNIKSDRVISNDPTAKHEAFTAKRQREKVLLFRLNDITTVSRETCGCFVNKRHLFSVCRL